MGSQLHHCRDGWGGSGGGQSALHSIQIDPRDAAHMFVSISTGGTYETRDGGASWTITSQDDDIGGVLRVQSAQIQAGEGAGPLLPVDALFLVSGTLRLEGGEYPVRGLFRHTRP